MKKALLLVAFVAACGPGDRGDDGNGSGSGSGSGNDCPGCVKVVGKIYAPKWAPGQVPAGQEIPVFGATVYVTDARPAPIPQQTYCESCADTPQGSVASKHDGSFELNVTGPGHYWLIIEKGSFRLEQEMDIPVGTTTLPPTATTLPEKHDPANGAWIPKVAIVKGNYDAVEDILGKIGFGTMSGNKMTNPDGEVTFYEWGATGNTSADYLISNISEMRKYHIIFFPCSTLVNDTATADQTKLKNIRQFVADGGKLYVTDWSGEVGDRAFPPQIQLGSDGFGTPDTVGTYNPQTLDGTITTAGDADGSLYDSADGKAIDPDLNMWLGLQTGPTEANPTPTLYNPNAFPVNDNWNWIDKLNSVMKGVDEDNMPVYDDPKAWVTASDESGHGPKPVAVTYEPAGCGKVLYSTFQTAGASASTSHVGLTPQERVLLFLIMEISDCTQNPVIL